MPPLFLLATVPVGGPVNLPPVSLAYTQQRGANGRPMHEGEVVTVTGVSSVASGDLQKDALSLFIQDPGAASPHGLAMFTTDLRANVAPGDIVEAHGQLTIYASRIEMRPDQLRVIGKTQPPSPIELPPEQLLGP